MGRNKIPIDSELVKRLASIHCPMEEIASVCACSVDTLEDRFSDIIRDARNTGKMSLRRKQVELAMSGNPQLLVWLGKVYLGQKDTTKLELTDEIVDTYISRKEATHKSTEVVAREQDKK